MKTQKDNSPDSSRLHSFSVHGRPWLFDPDTLRIYSQDKPLVQSKTSVNQDEYGLIDPVHTLEGYLLIITNRCNLRCTYCFADGGSYRLEPGSTMSVDTACRALDYLVETSRKKVFMVVFFGGEPLMEFDLIRQIVDYWEKYYSGKKKVVFGIVTNGTLLNKRVLQYCSSKKIKLLISLDGEKQDHDAARRYENGAGTYDNITRNLDLARQCLPENDLACSCTLTRTNMQVSRLFHHMADLGFSRMDFQMENIFDATSALKSPDMHALAAGFKTLFHDLAESGRIGEFKRIDIVYKFLTALEQRKKNRYFCYTGRTRYAVSPEGDLYPCIFFASQHMYCFGNVSCGITRPDILQSFAENRVESKPPCRECFARHLCGGGCAFAARLAGGSIAGVSPALCVLYRQVAALCLEYAVMTGQIGEQNSKEVYHA